MCIIVGILVVRPYENYMRGDCIKLYYIFIFKFKRMMQLEDIDLFVCGISKEYKKDVWPNAGHFHTIQLQTLFSTKIKHI